MVVIDMEALNVETVEATEDEVWAHMDEACQSMMGISAAEFIKALASGTLIEHPAAARLEVLARTFI